MILTFVPYLTHELTGRANAADGKQQEGDATGGLLEQYIASGDRTLRPDPFYGCSMWPRLDDKSVYGCPANDIRCGQDGKVKMEGPDPSGTFNPSNIMSGLFRLEHNAICDMLHARYPQWNDQKLFKTAVLINLALADKTLATTSDLHVKEWTADIGRNWQKDWCGGPLGGMVGGSRADQGVPRYTLGEDFLRTYEMHGSGADLVLNNYPTCLTDLSTDQLLPDLAAIDITTTKWPPVVSYNDTRRQLGLQPIASFDEIATPEAAALLNERTGGDVEKLDLHSGLAAEQLFPPTGAATYTEEGRHWLDNTPSLKTIMLRHYPQLESGLSGINNAFEPWPQGTAADEK